jgi:hypothetical protein
MASVMPITKLIDLLEAADVQRRMFAQVQNGRLVFGLDPLRPTNFIDFANEALGTQGESETAHGPLSARAPETNGARLSRSSGDYWLEVRGKRIECSSLKELLAEGLKSLDRVKPGTLDNLSRIRKRSRRIVARDANQLFDKPHLVKDYAEQLVNGWYYGTNNSARETEAWLRRAAECAGLTWGVNFRTSLGPSLDDIA